jgi:putative nucleotidyltransferase with HDIG domain
MFIHALEGPWLHHPFWRKRFLLTDPADLQKLRASAVPIVVIDDERGHAPPPPTAAPATSPKIASITRPVAAAPRRTDAPTRKRSILTPCSAREEFSRATQIVGRSKQAVTRMFNEARLGNAVTSATVAPLVDEIADSVARNPTALLGIARLKTKDEYTYLHSVAVCALMINLARHLEIDESLIRDIGLAGMLHDVGKMAIPQEILDKPGKLTDAEFAVIRQHPALGHEMLRVSGDVPEIALDVCLHHHEKYDGTGYPYRLAGEAISRWARMGAVCDVYDAITSNRPYKDGWAPAESLSRMEAWEGHFEPELLARFVRSIGIWPVGTLVRLRSNRLGVVVGENKADPTRPRVSAFYSIPGRELIAPETMMVANSFKGDQIIQREDPLHWNLGDWDQLQSQLVSGAA